MGEIGFGRRYRSSSFLKNRIRSENKGVGGASPTLLLLHIYPVIANISHSFKVWTW